MRGWAVGRPVVLAWARRRAPSPVWISSRSRIAAIWRSRACPRSSQSAREPVPVLEVEAEQEPGHARNSRIVALTRVAASMGCAALTAVLAVSRALDYAFWQDEVGSARVITRDGPVQMLRHVASTELHPPGFYSLGWLLTQLGAPPVWARSISVLSATLLSALVVLYAGRFVPVWGAALAGLATAVGWQFVAHAWELRPYSLFALTCVLFAWALERAAAQPGRGRLALLAAAVAAGSMTHYFFAFTLLGGLLWLRLVRAPRSIFVAVGVGLVPLLAWLPAAYKQYEDGGYRWIGSFRARAVIESYASLFYRGSAGYVVGLAVLVAMLAGAAVLWRRSDAGRLCALCALAPVAVATLVWAAGREIFLPRNLIGAAPFAAVAVAAALDAFPRRLAVPATAVSAALLLGLYVHTRGPIVPAYDRVADALVEQGWDDGDPILLLGPRYAYLHPLDWYLPGSRLELASLDGRVCARVFVVGVGGQGRALTAAAASESRVKRVVIARIPYRTGLADEIRRREGSVLATRAATCARVA